MEQIPDLKIPATELDPFPIYNTEKVNRGLEDGFSNTLNLIKTVVTQFKQNLYQADYTPPGEDLQQYGSPVPYDYELQTPVTFEPFTARFNNLLTGWSGNIEVQVTNTNDLCAAPVTYTPKKEI